MKPCRNCSLAGHVVGRDDAPVSKLNEKRFNVPVVFKVPQYAVVNSPKTNNSKLISATNPWLPETTTVAKISFMVRFYPGF